MQTGGWAGGRAEDALHGFLVAGLNMKVDTGQVRVLLRKIQHMLQHHAP